jgi:hypothetical protein
MDKKTHVKSAGVVVSTVLLPSMHIGGQYETMVFAADEAGEVVVWSELYCDRYETLSDAKAGHENVVLKYRNGCN